MEKSSPKPPDDIDATKNQILTPKQKWDIMMAKMREAANEPLPQAVVEDEIRAVSILPNH